MQVEGNMLVFAILGAAFAGVGIHLFAWSRRRAGVLRQFAESRGLVYRAEDVERLEQQVNRCVALDEPNMVRSFGQVGDVVTVGDGRLFRAVELLDLSPWGRSEYVNQSRTAMTFPFPCPFQGVFTVSPNMSVHQRYPESPLNADRLKTVLKEARAPAPPCTLSLTLMRGAAVAYLEPMVTGAVTRKHLEYLVDLMEHLVAS